MPMPIAVELVPHSPNWATSADHEMRRLVHALPDDVVAIHHIGSTAVPGIRAKPVLDLMAVVPSLADFDAKRERVVSLGYSWWGEYGIAGRRYCHFDDPETGRRLIQLHCFQFDSAEIARHLAFRDYLRNHPDVAHQYELEKLRCRELHPHNSHDYSHAKGPWIRNILTLAMAEFARQNPNFAGR